MKELPCIEEIYDFETDQLEHLLQEIDQMLICVANGQQVELPKGFDSQDKLERKALKLKEHLELELDERKQVDDVINFFVSKTTKDGVDLLSDDQFYQPLKNSSGNQQHEDKQVNQIMQNYDKHSQQHQQQQQQYLNHSNLAQLANHKDQPFHPQHDEQQSEVKFSTDIDTQSSYTHQIQHDNTSSSDLSKQMFAKRSSAMKNKKDLQAFMREKLQKTKISSEATSNIEPIAHNNNNFLPKKKLKVEESEPRSIINASKSVEKQSIYKPNLKRRTSTQSVSKSGNDNKAKQKKEKVEQVKENKDEKEVRTQRRSVTRQDSEVKVIKRSSSKTKEQKQETKQSQLKQKREKTSSNIYKPNNMKPTSRDTTSRPPLPHKQPKEESKINNKKIKEGNEKLQNNESSEVESVEKWNDENQEKEDELIGQEEIESKYSDNENDHDDHSHLLSSVDQQAVLESQFDSVAVDIKQSSKVQSRKSSNQIDHQNSLQSQQKLDSNEQLPQQYQTEILINNEQSNNIVKQHKEDIKLKSYSTQQINQDKDETVDQLRQDQKKVDEEEKINVNDYGNEEDESDDNDEEFYQQVETPIKDEDKLQTFSTTHIENQNQCLVKENSQTNLDEQVNHLVIDEIQAYNMKENQRQADNQKEVNQQSKGQVEIFNETNEAKNDKKDRTIQIDYEQYEKKERELDMQIEMLEKQDKELQQKPQQRQLSKRMELLQKIANQDESIKKSEQEQRLKQIREEMEREKKSKEKTEVSTKEIKAQVTEQVNTKQSEVEAIQKREEKKEEKKKPVKKGKKEKQVKPEQVPRQLVDSDQVVDYSPFYKTFYDIFVGQILDPKGFDLQYAIRDNRNMYAAFVNIMEVNSLQMKKKIQFEQAPTEKSLQDYYQVMPNFFTLTGKSVNDLELEFKNKSNELMLQALAQAQLKDRFDQQKQKDVNDIVKEAAQKAVQGADANSLIDKDRESSLFFRVVKNRTEVYDIISRAFARKKNWNELPHGLDLRNSWNLLWTWSKIKIDISKLIVWQRCNHFSGAKNVSRKDFLKRNIERAMKMSQKASQVFNITPITFILPKEYVGFLECFSEYEDKEGKMNYWIMKPAAKSRGRGISLVNDLTQITYGEPIVVQRYIKNPLLINGYKFDMRIYVLVTSVNPLEVFLYKDGFGRFSTIPFSLDPTDKNNKYIHLTNVSIQKYNVNNSEQDPSDLLYGGTKISIATLRKRFQQVTNVSWDDVIWPQVKEVIIKSLVACQNDIQYNPCSFELFGFDILIDSDFKCWLIEINSSPSLARDTLLDDMIKQKLIDDIIDLVNPLDFDRKRLFEVLERRINEDFKQSTTTNQYSKRLMNRDLTYILNGQVPRKYGEMPQMMGNFERLAPSPMSEQYLKLIGGQKMFGSMMKIQEQK